MVGFAYLGYSAKEQIERMNCFSILLWILFQPLYQNSFWAEQFNIMI
jgi:hypothetical protein